MISARYQPEKSKNIPDQKQKKSKTRKTNFKTKTRPPCVLIFIPVTIALTRWRHKSFSKFYFSSKIQFVLPWISNQRGSYEIFSRFFENPEKEKEKERTWDSREQSIKVKGQEERKEAREETKVCVSFTFLFVFVAFLSWMHELEIARIIAGERIPRKKKGNDSEVELKLRLTR